MNLRINPHATYEELEGNLVWNIADILHYGVILERKAQVGYLPKIGQLHIYADHNPPHFHIRANQHDLMVGLYDCEVIKGDLTSKQKKDLVDWFYNQQGQQKLIAFWNRFNPDNKIEGVAA